MHVSLAGTPWLCLVGNVRGGEAELRQVNLDTLHACLPGGWSSPTESAVTWLGLQAKHILLAVGGRATKISIPGAEHSITSDEILNLPEVPKRLACIGGGYISLEFASIYNHYGSEVHVVYRQVRLLQGCAWLLAPGPAGSGPSVLCSPLQCLLAGLQEAAVACNWLQCHRLHGSGVSEGLHTDVGTLDCLNPIIISAATASRLPCCLPCWADQAHGRAQRGCQT